MESAQPEISQGPPEKKCFPSFGWEEVKEFRINENRIFQKDDFEKLTAPYRLRISTEELQTLKQELTIYCIKKGYINSGVKIPDQEVQDGIISFQVVEGFLGEISVEGNHYLKSGYIEDRIRLDLGPPLNIYQIENALQLLKQDPRIKQLNADLNPGDVPGASRMKVTVEENNPFAVGIRFDNSRPPSIGAYRGELALGHRNLTGHRDIVDLRLGFSEGASDYGFSYLLPITLRDTAINIGCSSGQNRVIEEPFQDLDIESRTKTYSLGITRPFFRTPVSELRLGLTCDVRQEKTYLLDTDFSFSSLPDNVTRETVLRLSEEWSRRRPVEVIVLRSVFSKGIDALDATVSDSGQDGIFFAWSGQAFWLRQWPVFDLRSVFRCDIQLADDSLLPMEKFAVGGMNTVRGYRENQLVRDNGAITSFELRIPVLSTPERGVVLQLAPFIDMGWSWNTHQTTPHPRHISSIGTGFLWSIFKGADLAVYAGYGFRKMDASDHDLQDEGLHFQFTWQIF